MYRQNWLIHTTDNCNLDCSYCYRNEEKNTIISLDTFKKLIEESKRLGINQIGIIWHGGEPTLAGYIFFEEANNILEHYFNKNNIRQSIQTNGTLIDSNFINLFKKINMKVGISIDPLQEIHDSYRIFKNNKGSFNHVIDAINMLRDSNIDYSTISVITNEYYNKESELYEQLLKITKRANLNPYIKMGKNSDIIDIDMNKIIHIYQKIYDFWKKDKSTIIINPFKEMIDSLLIGRSKVCSLSSESCFSFLAIDSLGDIYNCNRLVNNKQFKLGNILQSNLENILQSTVIKKQYEHYKKINEECKNCEFLNNCNGGCYSDSLLDRNLEKTPFCNLYKSLFTTIKKDIGEIIDNR